MFEYLNPADRPVVDGLEEHEVVFAKDQPEYIPLRTLVSKDNRTRVMSRWTLTPEQRKAIAEGADVFLILSTFGNPLQPIQMAVSDCSGSEFAPWMKSMMGLEPSSDSVLCATCKKPVSRCEGFCYDCVKDAFYHVECTPSRNEAK